MLNINKKEIDFNTAMNVIGDFTSVKDVFTYINNYTLNINSAKLSHTVEFTFTQEPLVNNLIPIDGTKLIFVTKNIYELDVFAQQTVITKSSHIKQYFLSEEKIQEIFNNPNFFSVDFTISNKGYDELYKFEFIIDRNATKEEIVLKNRNVYEFQEIKISDDEISNLFENGLSDEELLLFLTSYGFDKVHDPESLMKVIKLRNPKCLYIKENHEYTDEEMEEDDTYYVNRLMNFSNMSEEIKLASYIKFSTTVCDCHIVNDKNPNLKWFILMIEL